MQEPSLLAGDLSQLLQKKSLNKMITPEPAAPEDTTPTTRALNITSGASDVVDIFNNSIYDMIYQQKPLSEVIGEMNEIIAHIPPDDYERMSNIAAEQLAMTTDKEGNKLFTSVSEAKQFLDSMRQKRKTRYKLPIAITTEIREKTPLTLSNYIKKEIHPITHIRGIYQF